jgi:hypothetical protein
MIRKCLLLVAISLFLGSIAFAEPQRAFFVKENRMPGSGKVEVGAIGEYLQVPDVVPDDGYDFYSVAPYVRYGLVDTLAVYGELPFVTKSMNDGDNQRGLGDVVAGAEFALFNDLFGYPFIIPHVEASFNTGDEDDGLMYGETLFTAGVSVGTVVMDMFHYIVDARYTLNADARDGSGDEKNVLTIAGAFIWDLNDRTSLIAEGKGSDDKDFEGNIPMYFQGGFGYQATEKVYVTILGGGGMDTDAEVLVSGKVSYSF